MKICTIANKIAPKLPMNDVSHYDRKKVDFVFFFSRRNDFHLRSHFLGRAQVTCVEMGKL